MSHLFRSVATGRVLLAFVVLSVGLLSGSFRYVEAQLPEEAAGPALESEPSPPPPGDPAKLERMELRVKRARIGLLSTTGVFAVGVGLTIAAAIRMPAAQADGSPDPVLLAGLSFLGAGSLGMITPGGITSHRAKELRRIKPLDPRVRRPRIGILSSTGVFLIGGMLTGIAGASANTVTGESLGALWAGVSVASAGLVGMIVSGTVLGVRKRQARGQERANYGKPRRARWDLATSRLMF